MGDAPLLAADPRGLRPGEQASYAMTLAGVELGDAAFAVGEPGERDGRPTIVVAARADASGLISLVKQLGADGEASLDAATGWPIDAEGTLRWGGKEFHGALSYDGSVIDGAWYAADGTVIDSVYRDTGGPPTHNVFSAMSAVRAWEGTPGERRDLYLHGAVNVWRGALTWVGREVIGTAKGNVAAVRIDGECRLDSSDDWTIHVQIWVSDDADRVPLRMTTSVWRFGATFELTDYVTAAST